MWSGCYLKSVRRAMRTVAIGNSLVLALYFPLFYAHKMDLIVMLAVE